MRVPRHRPLHPAQDQELPTCRNHGDQVGQEQMLNFSEASASNVSPVKRGSAHIVHPVPKFSLMTQVWH